MPFMDVVTIAQRKLTGSRYADSEITEAVKEAEFLIRNYCGRWQYELDNLGDPILEELPKELNYIWANIAIDLLGFNYRTAQVSAAIVDIISTGGIKQIKEGDTTIEFNGSSQTDTGIKSSLQIVSNYAADLQPFRRVYAAIREV